MPTSAMPTSDLPLSAHIDPWILFRRYAPTSARQRRCLLTSFAATVGDPAPTALTTALVHGWWQTLGRLRPASARAHLIAARSFTTWLGAGAAFADIGAPHIPRSDPVTLTETQIVALFGVCDQPESRALFALMLGSGLRCIDCARLQVEDIDLSSRLMRVTGKGCRVDVVPVPLWALQPIARFVAGRRSGPMFVASAASIGATMTALMVAAGVKVSAHDGRGAHALRRTCATRMLGAGVSIRVVQRVLRHTELSSTERYLAVAESVELIAGVDAA